MNDFKFLKATKMKHPTRDVILEYIQKSDAIAALILNVAGDKALLVKQYRPGANEKLLEIPAGIIEPQETAEQTLKREIREETGYNIESFNILYKPTKPLILSPGYTTEKLYIYILQLKSDNEIVLEKQLDIGEDLESYWMNINEIENSTNDFKTHYALILNKRGEF